MKPYGKVAIAAVQLCTKFGHDPRTAWNAAAKKQFPNSPSSQAKGCPRGAFMGLCVAGWVRGVETEAIEKRMGKNARYAVDAVNLLRAKKPRTLTAKELWSKVGHGIRHNSQMDVVLALWSRGLIQGS